MCRFTRKPSSGSHSQYLTKITPLVQCGYVELVQNVNSVMAAYYDLWGLCAVHHYGTFTVQTFGNTSDGHCDEDRWGNIILTERISFVKVWNATWLNRLPHHIQQAESRSCCCTAGCCIFIHAWFRLRLWGAVPRNRVRFSAVHHAHWMWEWVLWVSPKVKNE